MVQPELTMTEIDNPTTIIHLHHRPTDSATLANPAHNSSSAAQHPPIERTTQRLPYPGTD
jgi:hypothetical protein